MVGTTKDTGNIDGVTSYTNTNLGLRQTTVRPIQAQGNKEYNPPSPNNDWEKYIASSGTVIYTNQRLDQTQYDHPSNLQGGSKLLWENSKCEKQLNAYCGDLLAVPSNKYLIKVLCGKTFQLIVAERFIPLERLKIHNKEKRYINNFPSISSCNNSSFVLLSLLLLLQVVHCFYFYTLDVMQDSS